MSHNHWPFTYLLFCLIPSSVSLSPFLNLGHYYFCLGCCNRVLTCSLPLVLPPSSPFSKLQPEQSFWNQWSDHVTPCLKISPLNCQIYWRNIVHNTLLLCSNVCHIYMSLYLVAQHVVFSKCSICTWEAYVLKLFVAMFNSVKWSNHIVQACFCNDFLHLLVLSVTELY